MPEGDDMADRIYSDRRTTTERGHEFVAGRVPPTNLCTLIDIRLEPEYAELIFTIQTPDLDTYGATRIPRADLLSVAKLVEQGKTVKSLLAGEG